MALPLGVHGCTKASNLCRKATSFSDDKFQADFLSALEPELKQMHPIRQDRSGGGTMLIA